MSNTSSGPDPTTDPGTGTPAPSTDPGTTTTTPPPSSTPTSTEVTTPPPSTPEPSTSPTPSPSTSPTPSPSNTSPDPTSNEPTSTNPPPSTEETSIVTVTPSSSDSTSTLVTTVTSGTSQPNTSTSISSSATGTSTVAPSPQDQTSSDEGGLPQGAKIAVAVVVPIVGVTLLILAALFLWRRRRARKAAEEQRKQELDDYAYTPHADPTIPSIGLASDGHYAVKEDGSGYRGWGTTVAGSGRQGSTTLSGGLSDTTSPTQVNEAPMTSAFSSEGEILGAMAARTARGNDGVHRGPSNASSSYSAARSDASDGIGLAYGSGAPYYEAYNVGNPYEGPQSGSPPRPSDASGPQQPAPPIIRDNPARHNPRIENPAHYPQQTAGISQNF